MFSAQLEALRVDLPAAAIKSGMLGSRTNVELLADFLDSQTAPPPLVCDPVLKSTSGADLLDPEALDMLISGIFPHVTVLTPNLPEAAKLLGIESLSSIEESAGRILEMGVHSVLIKGGHAGTDDCCDYWTDGTRSVQLSSPRIETTATHGTGCILSAAIAAGLALGKDLPAAVIDAKTFLNQCLRLPVNAGGGRGPAQIGPFMNAPQDRPAAT